MSISRRGPKVNSLASTLLKGDYYSNTFVRSPVNGLVVKQFMNPDESISYESLYQPIVSVADTTHLMARSEVGETEVGKVEIGHRAEIRCEAFPGQTFRGRVVRVSGGLGRKKIQSDNPLEKIDREIVESFVEVGPSSPLRFGLRVDLYFPMERKENVLIIARRVVELPADFARVRVRPATGLSPAPVRLVARDGLKEGDVVVC